MKPCPSCGRVLKSGQLLCECGASAGFGKPELGAFAGVDVKVPALDFDRSPTHSFDFSSPLGQSNSQPKLDFPEIAGTSFTLRGGAHSRGTRYRPVLAVGEAAQGTVKLHHPVALALLPDRGFLVLDFATEGGPVRIQRFDCEGGLCQTVRQGAAESVGNPISVPAALAVNQHGHIFVTDMDGSCVIEFAPDGAFVACRGSEGTGKGQLTNPRAVAADASGAIFIADSGNHRVVRWSSAGEEELVIGINQLDEGDGWLRAGDGPGEFDDPQGLALGSDGAIFVADTNNHRVQAFDRDGRFVSAFGSEGQDAGLLSYPSHVHVGPESTVFVADLAGRRIQKFDTQGRFAWDIVLPADAGAMGDFAVDSSGRILVALRKRHVVMGMEVD
jgi:hypothetical protein